jgi:hypothetical protein
MPMTAERRRRGAQRLNTSELTRHPGQPCIEQAAPSGRVDAVARGHRTIFGVSQAIDDHAVAALMSASASS